MKKAALFATILALALGARAQTVNFAALPAVSNPTLLPNGYSNLNWSGFYYVDPIWSGAGAGFRQGPNSLDVAYMGGGECEKAGVSCSASISSNASAANALAGFKAQSAIVAAGYHSETINVSAYNHGHFVGSANYNLSTSLQQINFSAGWGMITQLVMDTNSGTLVLYALNLQSVSATAQGVTNAEGAGATSLDNTVGPTAPIHVLDPPKNGDGGSAVIGPGPVTRGSERTIANADTIKPPIIVITPTAPKKPGPVTHESENIIADRGVISPPIIVITPTAPKKPSPVAHESETVADVRTVLPGPIVIGPKAPKKPSPVAHASETMADVRTVLPGPIVIGPKAPKKPGPVAHVLESANV
jgi:hypothetical protein